MPREKIVWYSDPLHDDFAASKGKIDATKIDGSYDYGIGGPIRRFLAFVFYRLIATPVAFLFCKTALGYRIRDRKILRGLKSGYFLYGNHTQDTADAFLPTLLTFPRRCDIITSQEAVSIPGLRYVVARMGAVPLGTTLEGKIHFLKALKDRIGEGHAVAIYPEAHIWPWYNGIRPFPDGSFAFPMRLGVPAVPYVVVYRRRKIFQNMPPRAEIILGPVLRPEDYNDRKAMRDAAFEWMRGTAEREQSYAWIEYRERKTS